MLDDKNLVPAQSASLAETGSKSNVKIVWFLRITGALIVIACIAAFSRVGWPRSWREVGRLEGLVCGMLLFVMSFTYVTTGRKRNIVAVIRGVLTIAVVALLLAKIALYR
jgi:hypothetical protein